MRLRGFLTFLLLALAVFLPAPVSAARDPLPWQEGDILPSGWQVESIEKQERFKEFVRIHLSRAGEKTAVEIAFNTGFPSESATAHYRIQPAPAAAPPEYLLKEFIARLEELEKTGGTAPLVQPHPPTVIPSPFIKQTAPPSTLWLRLQNAIRPDMFHFLLLCLSLLLAAYLAAAWFGLHPERRGLAAGAGLAAAALAVFLFGFLLARDIPIGWVTALQSGSSINNINQIYAQGVHSGTVYSGLLSVLFPKKIGVLMEVVRLNLFLAGVNALLFLLLAGVILESFPAAAILTLVAVFNVNFILPALSGLPSQLVSLLFLFGVGAAAVFNERERFPSPVRIAALTQLLLLTWLAVNIRPELGLIGLAALLMAALRLSVGEERLARHARSWLSQLGRYPSWSLRNKLLVLLAASLFWLTLVHLPAALEKLSRYEFRVWAFDSLNPLNSSFVVWAQDLSGTLPAAMVILIVLGMIYGFRRLGMTFLLPLTLLLLYKLYYSASHLDYYERFRYLTSINLMILFMALFGWRQLQDFAESRKWLPVWRHAALLLLTVFLFTTPGGSNHNFDPPFITSASRVEFANVSPLIRNMQVEVQYLLSIAERYPECTIVSKVQRQVSDRSYRLALFGKNYERPATFRFPVQGSDFLIRQLTSPDQCVLFYYALDCNQAEFDVCGKDVAGYRKIDEIAFPSKQYLPVYETGRRRPVIRLALYSVAEPFPLPQDVPPYHATLQNILRVWETSEE